MNKFQSIWDKIPVANCKKKCQDCCRLVTCSIEEKQLIKSWLKSRGKQYKPFTIDEILNNPCPYLVDGLCEIYEVRPTICRLWGVTEDMRCFFGCKPEKVLSKIEKEKLQTGD